MKWTLYLSYSLLFIVSCRVSQPNMETFKNDVIEDLCVTKGEPNIVLDDYNVSLHGHWTQKEIKEILTCLNILTSRVSKKLIRDHRLSITKIKFNQELYFRHLAEYKEKYPGVPDKPPAMGYTLDHLSVGLTAHARSDCGIFMPPLQVMNGFEDWAQKYEKFSYSNFVWQSNMFRQFLMHEIMHCFMFDAPGYIEFHMGLTENLGDYFQPWVDLEKKIKQQATSLAMTRFEKNNPALKGLKVSYPTGYAEKNSVEAMADCFAYFALWETFKHYDPWLIKRLEVLSDFVTLLEKNTQTR